MSISLHICAPNKGTLNKSSAFICILGSGYLWYNTSEEAQWNLCIHVPVSLRLILFRFLIICTVFSLTPTHSGKLSCLYKMTYTAEDEPTLVSGCMGTAVFATPLDLATIYFIHQTDSFVPTSILHINPHTHNYNSVENVKSKGMQQNSKDTFWSEWDFRICHNVAVFSTWLLNTWSDTMFTYTSILFLVVPILCLVQANQSWVHTWKARLLKSIIIFQHILDRLLHSSFTSEVILNMSNDLH